MIFRNSELRHIGFRTVRQQPAAGDRVLWDGDGWYFARRGEVAGWTLERGRTVRNVMLWRRQVGPHKLCAKLRYFDELTRLIAWPSPCIDATGNFVEGVVVDYTHDWECNRSPRAIREHELISKYLGGEWNRPHPIAGPRWEPVMEITEPEPFVWPEWADDE